MFLVYENQTCNCPIGYTLSESWDGQDRASYCTACGDMCRVCGYEGDGTFACTECTDPNTEIGSNASCQCKSGFQLKTDANGATITPMSCEKIPDPNAVCSDWEYQSGTECYVCPASCVTCELSTSSASAAVCVECPYNSTFDDNGECECFSGLSMIYHVESTDYYQYQRPECVDCPANCNRCWIQDGNASCYECATGYVQSTANQLCDICADGYAEIDGRCVEDCQATYFRNTLGVCEACNERLRCLSCTSTESCTSCRNVDTEVLVNGQCVCQDGYYQTDNGCQSCQETCAACTGTDYQCTACHTNYSLVALPGTFNTTSTAGTASVGECYCIGDYMINPYTEDCIRRCDAGLYPNEVNDYVACVGKCEECVSDGLCTRCKEDRSYEAQWYYDQRLQLDIIVCACLDGYYESITYTSTTQVSECLACNPECATCQYMRSCENIDFCEESSCTSCNDYATLGSDGNCQCRTGYEMGADGYCYVVVGNCGAGLFEDEDGTCYPCHGPCVNCDSDEEGECTGECKDFAQFEAYNTDGSKGQCECIEGFGLDPTSLECVECIDNCRYCSAWDYTLCDECVSPYVPEEDSNGNVIQPIHCICPWGTTPCVPPAESGVCVQGVNELDETCICHASCFSCIGEGV